MRAGDRALTAQIEADTISVYHEEEQDNLHEVDLG